MDERPDHAIVHAEAPGREFADQPMQGELALPAAHQQPVPIRPDQFLRPVSADLPGCQATGPPIPVNPVDCRADRHFEAPCRLVTGQAVPFHRLQPLHEAADVERDAG